MGVENKTGGLMSRREFTKLASLSAAGAFIASVFGTFSPLPVKDIETEKPQTNGLTKKLLLLADIHIENVNHALPRQVNTLAATRLQSTVDQLKETYFDSIIQLGDLITDIDNQKTNINNYKKGLKIIKQLDPLAINIPGNHDVCGIGTGLLSQTLKESGFTSSLYGVKEISPDYQFIWLDLSARKGGQTFLPDERIDWIREVVKPDTPTIIFSHFGLLPVDTEGNYYYRNDPSGTAFTNGPTVWKYISDLPIRAVISAHVHEGTFSVVGHTNMLTVPSFTENIASPRPTNPAVYSILELTGRRLNLKSYSGKYCFNSVSIAP